MQSPLWLSPTEACTTVPFTESGASSDTEQPILTYICYVIGVFGICGNAFVMVVIASSKSMRKRYANVFILNQSCIDGLASIFLVAGAIPYEGRHTKWLCKLWLTRLPFWSLTIASTHNLIFLNIDRYIAIVHPLWHRTKFGSKTISVMLFFPWLFGILFNCLYMIPTSDVEHEHCDTYKLWKNLRLKLCFGVALLICQYVIPIAIMSYCYGRIIWVVRQRSRSEKRRSSDEKSDENMMGSTVVLTQIGAQAYWSKAERNSVQTAFIISFSFILCWTVNQVVISSEFFGVDVDYESPLYIFSIVLVQFNCCVNPFIYALQYKSFQTTAMKLLCRRSQQLDSPKFQTKD